MRKKYQELSSENTPVATKDVRTLVNKDTEEPVGYEFSLFT